MALALAASTLVALPLPVSAQYFGRNKVQYDDFDFRVLTTDHFDLHYYEEESEAINDVVRMAERWYERFARLFQHDFEARKPLIIYADHPDFQQTNTLRGFIGESTGGVTESLKNRVILPLTGSYASSDHVLGHEIVHAFQYNLAQSRRAGGGIQGLARLPLWLVEGMAEYLSVGRESPLTAMWLRDAIRRDDFPTIKQLTTDPRFFPYRFGQGLWAYIGGTYGDEAVSDIYRRAVLIGFQNAIGQRLGVSIDTLSAQWRRQVEQQYIPLMTGRTDPPDLGTPLVTAETGGGQQNISPSVSPNGDYVAFYSERGLFSIDLYLADGRTGEVIRKLSSADSDPHVDALRYTESSGAWSPDGERFVYAVFEDGDNAFVIINARNGRTVRKIKPEGIGALNHPAWSPDGRYIAFTGIKGGVSDLYLFDLEDESVEQLTNDRHADFHPEWSPDGSTIAFASDRGPETNFETLVFSEYRIALLDVATREIDVLEIFGNARHSNPQYAPDGESLYFLSDQDGFSDIYNLDFGSGTVRRLTRVVTGVSGITTVSPALSVADNTGEIVFSVFGNGFDIHSLPPESGGLRMAREIDEADMRGRLLPPAETRGFDRVAQYLADPLTGLPDTDVYRTTGPADGDYSPSLSLDLVGQPSIGVGANSFGSTLGGGASAFFSDMLGNKLLGVAVLAQGTFKDIGGQVQYADIGNRWNWGVQGARIPFALFGFRNGTDDNGNNFLGQVRQRIFLSSASGTVAYPFSQTRRVEFTGGLTRYSYDVEEDRFIFDPSGTRIIGVERVEIDTECGSLSQEDPVAGTLCKPESLNFGQVSAAYVGDNSFFAFVGPVRGERFRFELEQTAGSVTFSQILGDYRRYYQVDRNLTIGWRGLTISRFGSDLTEDITGAIGGRFRANSVIQPIFLGFETLIRGYAFESFTNEECIASQGPGQEDINDSCPGLSRLFGHKIAVANLEARIPLFGVEQFGLINFPILPTELVFFTDAGLAWTDFDNVDLSFDRTATRRVPVFSSGVSARTNIFGILVLESYYAFPWQRPDRGWHWGFQIAPAW